MQITQARCQKTEHNLKRFFSRLQKLQDREQNRTEETQAELNLNQDELSKINCQISNQTIREVLQTKAKTNLN